MQSNKKKVKLNSLFKYERGFQHYRKSGIDMKTDISEAMLQM